MLPLSLTTACQVCVCQLITYRLTPPEISLVGPNMKRKQVKHTIYPDTLFDLVCHETLDMNLECSLWDFPFKPSPLRLRTANPGTWPSAHVGAPGAASQSIELASVSLPAHEHFLPYRRGQIAQLCSVCRGSVLFIADNRVQLQTHMPVF